MRTLIIGRSRYADLILPGESVAPRHAELVITEAGRYHLTDCAGGGGTFRRDDRGGWAALRQGYVGIDDRLRFARHETDLKTLLRNLSDDPAGRWRYGAGAGGGSSAQAPRGLGNGAGDKRPAGRVERDPLTGEIVRMGF